MYLSLLTIAVATSLSPTPTSDGAGAWIGDEPSSYLGITKRLGDQTLEPIVFDVPGWVQVRIADGISQPQGDLYKLLPIPNMTGFAHGGSRGAASTPSEWDASWAETGRRHQPAVLIDPPIALLRVEPNSNTAIAEVMLTSGTGENVDVEVSMGCSFAMLSDSPMIVGAEPTPCRVALNLSSSLHPEKFSIILLVGDERVTVPIPIAWGDERPSIFHIDSNEIVARIGEPINLSILATEDHIELFPPKATPGLDLVTTRGRAATADLSLVVTDESGYGSLPIHVDSDFGFQELRVLLLPPRPRRLASGVPLLGGAVVPGERIWVVRPNENGIERIVFPDRLPGAALSFTEEERLAELYIPGDARPGAMKIVTDQHALALWVDQRRSELIPNWAVTWY